MKHAQSAVAILAVVIFLVACATSGKSAQELKREMEAAVAAEYDPDHELCMSDNAECLKIIVRDI